MITSFKRSLVPLAFFSLLANSVSAGETNVYWGDTPMHTGNSFDVYLFGTPTSDWAYTNRPATIQERAYSSPIWFSP